LDWQSGSLQTSSADDGMAEKHCRHLVAMLEGDSPSEREPMRIHLRTNSGSSTSAIAGCFRSNIGCRRFETIPSKPISQALAKTSVEA
jgi:hypothetical protein